MVKQQLHTAWLSQEMRVQVSQTDYPLILSMMGTVFDCYRNNHPSKSQKKQLKLKHERIYQSKFIMVNNKFMNHSNMNICFTL